MIRSAGLGEETSPPSRVPTLRGQRVVVRCFPPEGADMYPCLKRVYMSAPSAHPGKVALLHSSENGRGENGRVMPGVKTDASVEEWLQTTAKAAESAGT